MPRHKLPRRGLLFGTAGVAATSLIGLPAHAEEKQVHNLDKGGAQWSLIDSLTDEFYDTVRSDSLWHRGLWYPQSGVGKFQDSNVSFSGSELQLEARKEVTSTSNYTFGAVESIFDTPGLRSYVEIRAKVLASAANVLSAFWLQSSNLDGIDVLADGANPNPEIDVVETFSFSHMDMATHIWPDNRGDLHIGYGGSAFNTGVQDMSAAYHTFGIERRDGFLRFYFDRQLAWELRAPHPSLWQMSRHVVLSLEGHRGKPNDAGLPNTFDIDYVRTYYDTSGRRAKAGRYYLRNTHTGLVITADGAGDLRLESASGSHSQSWHIRESDDFTYLVRGFGNIALGLDKGMGQVGVPAVAVSQPNISTDIQGSRHRWHIVPADGKAFRLHSKFSGLALSAQGHTVVQQQPNTGADLWELVRWHA